MRRRMFLGFGAAYRQDTGDFAPAAGTAMARGRFGARGAGRRSLAGRTVVALLALAAGLGTVALTAPEQAQAADGTPRAAATKASTDSHITVDWAGGAQVGEGARVSANYVEKSQPNHVALTSVTDPSDSKRRVDNKSGHWNDFKNLKVTVSQTADVQDQAVTVTATGMPGATTSSCVGTGSCKDNYLQVMQCWGQNPNDADFAQTCQFGGLSGDNGTASSYPLENQMGAFAYQRERTGAGQTAGAVVPFRAVSGKVSQPSTSDVGWHDGTSAFFSSSSTNEKPLVTMGSDGSATVAFSTQAGKTQPYLGCGTKAAMRCWLVVVPRGSHSGELSPSSEYTCVKRVYGGVPWGQQTTTQAGSPLDPSCSYFQDRIVIPLDFRPVQNSCAAGSAELAVEGTEAISGAMSSWQQGLCEKGDAYSLVTNSGDLVRSHLLTGLTGLGVVGTGLTKNTIGGTDPSLLDSAKLQYAPLANTGLVIGYVANDNQLRYYTDLKMTPRLLAKVLTQSYTDTVPMILNNGNYQPGSNGQLNKYWPHRADSLQADPEFLALNPQMKLLATSTTQNGVFVTVGPQGDDAYRLLWRYIQADADARAFLQGKPDPWGDTMNPYYLPSTNPDARGGGLSVDLSKDPADSVLRADQTLEPPTEKEAAPYRGQQMDSVTLLPYSSSFVANAQRVFNAATQWSGQWDQTAFNAAGEMGAFAQQPPGLDVSGRFTVGPVFDASAVDFGLSVMQLAQPLDYRTGQDDLASARTFVTPTQASIQAGLPMSTAGSSTSRVKADPDFSKLSQNAYPLTTTVYGAVNQCSSALNSSARGQYAAFLDYAAGVGNASSTDPGKLPIGYVPLTASQRAGARAVAAALKAGTPGDCKQTTPGTRSTGPGSGGSGRGVSDGGSTGVGPASVTVPGQGPDGSEAGTMGPTGTGASDVGSASPAVSGQDAGASSDQTPGAAAAALGGTLLAAAGGLLGSPLLLRRKGDEGGGA